MVDSLEEFLVESLGLIAFELDLQDLQCICQPLDTDTDGPVSTVRPLRLLTWVVIFVDDSVQVPGNDFGHFVQLLEVEDLPLIDVPGERYGGEVAHSYLVGGGILDDLTA